MLVSADALLESLLADDVLQGLCGDVPLPLPPRPSSLFPCLADELEQQAKALEGDWHLHAAALAWPQPAPRPAAPLPTNTLPAPALRFSALDLERRQDRPVRGPPKLPSTPHLPGALPLTPPPLLAGCGLRLPPPTLGPAEGTPARVQPPPQPLAAARTVPPLGIAIHNAECVRLRRESPWDGAWRGCLSTPWCSRHKDHEGLCTSGAEIPGLGAYSQEELSTVGLAWMTHLTSPLPPTAAVAAARAATAAAVVSHRINALDSGPVVGAAVPPTVAATGPPTAALAHASSEDSDGSLLASDNNSNNGDEEAVTLHRRAAPAGGGEAEQQRAGSKRKRAAAAAAALAAAEEGGVKGEEDGTDTEAASEEPKSSLTAEPQLRVAADAPRNARGGARARGGRVAGGDAPPAQRARVGGGGSRKGPAAKKGPNGAAAGGAVPPRPTQRRGPQQWLSGEVVDPRSGRKVKEVSPATFCTQCSALSTPVWRAGPFGHKTLCNACGVRWMKVAPKNRK